MNQDKIKRITDLRNMYKKTSDEEDQRCFLIQIEQLLPTPKKTLYIDADSLIFYAAYSSNNSSSIPEIEGSFIGDNIDIFEDLKASFHSIVNEVVSACKKHSLLGEMVTFKDYKLVFTPSTNFRYELFSDYKISRKDRDKSDDEIKLRKYAHTIGIMVDNVEADDVVAYYGRHGHPIASGDKDVIYGVPGKNYYYHSHHQKVVNITKEDAKRFTLLQTLSGDGGDYIPGIKGVGLKNKLLPDNATFDDVIKIYENSIICISCLDDPKGRFTTYDKIDDLEENDGNLIGTCPKCKCIRGFKQYTKKDAILNRRLVGMDQWKGFIRGLKLFKYKGGK